MSEGFPCFNSWGVKKASCLCVLFLWASLSALLIQRFQWISNSARNALMLKRGAGWRGGLKHPCKLGAQHTRVFWGEMSNSRLVFDAFPNKYVKIKMCVKWSVWDTRVQHCSLCLPVRLIRSVPVLSSHTSVRKEKPDAQTWLIALLCGAKHYRHTAELSSGPPGAPNKYQSPDKSTVLFFPFYKSQFKERSWVPPSASCNGHEMNWCLRWSYSAAAPSQHANMAPKKPSTDWARRRRPVGPSPSANKTAPKLIPLSVWRYDVGVTWQQGCKKIDTVLHAKTNCEAYMVAIVAFASFNTPIGL